ncbi:MAG: sigma-70 family RNA polymerase sigma factor [Eubacterium sp.]|nr:sigma-70 family RNA polymerase sigma factor [Eubacterium sp.]
MEDSEIIRLFQMRNEEAVAELSKKYGRYCRVIADNVLKNVSDAEECINDVFLKVWDSIPPAEPKVLSAYVARIAKNTALDRYDRSRSVKRGSGISSVSFDELGDLISGTGSVEANVENKELLAAINNFLAEQPKKKRLLFLGRYWHYFGISELAGIFAMTEHNVTVTLGRIRKKLKAYLLKRGFDI